MGFQQDDTGYCIWDDTLEKYKNSVFKGPETVGKGGNMNRISQKISNSTIYNLEIHFKKRESIPGFFWNAYEPCFGTTWKKIIKQQKINF